MFCKKCGKQIPDDSVFCPYCGTNNSMDAAEEAPEEISAQPLYEHASKETPSEKPKKRGKTGIVWVIVALAIIGIAAFAAINYFNLFSTNMNDSGTQVYAFRRVRRTAYTIGSIDDLESFYSKYYLYKKGNKWALFDPKTKVELNIGGSDGMKEVQQHGNRANVFYIINGKKWAVFSYVRVSQSEEESIISAIESKPRLFP